MLGLGLGKGLRLRLGLGSVRVRIRLYLWSLLSVQTPSHPQSNLIYIVSRLQLSTTPGLVFDLSNLHVGLVLSLIFERYIDIWTVFRFLLTVLWHTCWAKSKVWKRRWRSKRTSWNFTTWFFFSSLHRRQMDLVHALILSLSLSVIFIFIFIFVFIFVVTFYLYLILSYLIFILSYLYLILSYLILSYLITQSSCTMSRPFRFLKRAFCTTSLHATFWLFFVCSLSTAALY